MATRCRSPRARHQHAARAAPGRATRPWPLRAPERRRRCRRRPGDGGDRARRRVARPASLHGGAHRRTAIQTQKAVLRSGVVVSCRTNRSATCVLRIELAGKDARRLGLARSARTARGHRSGDRPHRGRDAPSSEAAADQGGRQQAAPRRARERRGGRRGRVDRRRQVQVLALDPRAPALGDSSRAPARRFSGCAGRTNDEIGDLPLIRQSQMRLAARSPARS